MKFETASFVEHRNHSVQAPLLSVGEFQLGMVAPGASTCCYGCTSCSSAAVPSVG